jgi:hypothetical protein
MTMNPRSRFLYELRIAFPSIALYGLAIPPKRAYSAAMPQAHPAIRRRYSVLVKRQGRAAARTWAWEIRRMPDHLAVQLQRDGFNTAKAATRAGREALHTLLESLSEEKPNA